MHPPSDCYTGGAVQHLFDIDGVKRDYRETQGERRGRAGCPVGGDCFLIGELWFVVPEFADSLPPTAMFILSGWRAQTRSEPAPHGIAVATDDRKVENYPR